MTFDEVLGRSTKCCSARAGLLRGIKRRFALDDEYLEDLKEELIVCQVLEIADEDGKVLVWNGEAATCGGTSLSRLPAQSPAPAATRPPSGRAYPCRASGDGSAWSHRR